jgi:hypothetical protein
MKRVLGMICLCFHLAENDIPRNLLLVRNRGTPLEWKSISTPRLVMYEDEVQTGTKIYLKEFETIFHCSFFQKQNARMKCGYMPKE